MNFIFAITLRFDSLLGCLTFDRFLITIYAMKKLIYILTLALAFLHLAGCAEQEAVTPPAFMPGSLKIGDLAPKKIARPTMESMFEVVTFEVPMDNIEQMEEMFELLRDKPLSFQNRQAFKDNGFDVGFGQSGTWQALSAVMQKALARKVKTSKLAVFDDDGDDILANILYRPVKFFYTRADGSIDLQDIGPGRIMLRIKSTPVVTSRGVVTVSVLPVFSMGGENSIARLAGKKKIGETAFDAAQFQVDMAAGDFIFLTSDEPDQGMIMLSELFFRTERNIKVRNPEFSSDPKKNVGKSAMISKDMPLARIYVILCTGVKG